MRGIILGGLLNRYSPKKVIIASVLIFRAWHFNILQFVNTTLVGMVYYKTNSLILCIAAHMTNNTISVIMEYTEHSFNAIIFLGVIIFIGSAMLFFRYLKEFDGKLGINKSYKEQEVL